MTNRRNFIGKLLMSVACTTPLISPSYNNMNFTITPSHKFNQVWEQGFSSVCTFDLVNMDNHDKYVVNKYKIFKKATPTNVLIELKK